MKLLVLTVGKPKLQYARAGAEEYFSRLQHYLPVEWKQVKAGTPDGEGEQLLAASEGLFRVALDERGDLLSSRDLAGKLAKWEQQALKSVAFLIGGADGHAEALRKSAGWLWSLGPLTLQHELALVVMLEQLYRAQTIRRGEPYHRD